MPTEQSIEEESKKRKLDDVGDDGLETSEAKEPEAKKLATDADGVKETSIATDATASTTNTTDAESNSANGTMNDDEKVVEDRVAPNQDDTPASAEDKSGEEGSAKNVDEAVEADAKTASNEDDTNADGDKDATTDAEKKQADDDDEVIVIATKNTNSVAAAVAAAAAATPDHSSKPIPDNSIRSIINAAASNSNGLIDPHAAVVAAHHAATNGSANSSSPPPAAENLPFPKLDEASMSGMSQSERKRYREKKRRSEITQAIDKLTKILLKVEPANLFSQNNLVYSTNTSDLVPSRSGGRSGGSGQQPLNRTEIINHAVKVLEKLHRENEERKMQLMRLHTVVSDASANGTVAGGQPTMMMMPAQPMIYQAAPQAKMPGAFNATAIPVQAVPAIQMQHPASFMQNATAYHVPSSGSPVDQMPKGMVMVPAAAHGAPAGHPVAAAPGHPVAAGADGQQQQRAFEQFYFSQQLQQQRMREPGAGR